MPWDKGNLRLWLQGPPPRLVVVDQGLLVFDLASGNTISEKGHFDFLDQSQAIAESYCTPEGTVDGTLALDTAAHYMMAFFARELLGDSSVGPAFDGAGAQADIAAGVIAVQSK